MAIINANEKLQAAAGYVAHDCTGFWEGQELSRAAFWRMTRDFGEQEMKACASMAEALVGAHYSGVPAGDDTERDRRWAMRMCKSWFRPWTRLAGELEARVEDAGKENDLLCRICDAGAFAYSSSRFAPYRQNLYGWVHNRCRDEGLDYTLVPHFLKTEELEASFRKECPECVLSGIRRERMKEVLKGEPFPVPQKKDAVNGMTI